MWIAIAVAVTIPAQCECEVSKDGMRFTFEFESWPPSECDKQYQRFQSLMTMENVRVDAISRRGKIVAVTHLPFRKVEIMVFDVPQKAKTPSRESLARAFPQLNFEIVERRLLAVGRSEEIERLTTHLANVFKQKDLVEPSPPAPCECEFLQDGVLFRFEFESESWPLSDVKQNQHFRSLTTMEHARVDVGREGSKLVGLVYLPFRKVEWMVFDVAKEAKAPSRESLAKAFPQLQIAIVRQSVFASGGAEDCKKLESHLRHVVKQSFELPP